MSFFCGKNRQLVNFIKRVDSSENRLINILTKGRKCMRKSVLIGLSMLLGITLSACNSDATRNSGMSLVQKSNPTPTLLEENTKHNLDLVAKVKKDVAKFEELYDVAVVKGEHEILVAYKVKHLQRFHMVKIEGQINEMLEKKYPKENFIVSSDFKIFLEAVELNDHMKDPNYSEKEAQDKLNEIIELKKELT